jgi:thioesterase domain-containing protein
VIPIGPAITVDALAALETTLHREIPLTRAMGVTVVRFDAGGLTLAAPLAANLNHKRTAFGGSLAALATLAGWGLLQLLLRDHAPTTVVIRDSTVRYLHPVTQDIEATCPPPAAPELERFLRMFERRGMARIELVATIPAGGEEAVQFRGGYVALNKARHPQVEPV